MIAPRKPLPDWVARARAGWQWRGAERPPFALTPGPGQESVWDYPRPPVIVADTRQVVVRQGSRVVADTRRAHRLLETSHPPTWYLPGTDVDRRCLVPAGPGSFCEWKGEASYFDVVVGDWRCARAAWSYPAVIDEAYADIAGAFAFYAHELLCFVDGEPVTPQPGGFYGGWVTPEIVGPWKGDPGSSGW
ncbi:MAG: DUF427 domain-containing protein [Polyangiaceae bacterium]